ncbi:MAG: YeeE/YedE family protein [Planctomycetes bacterium]|nr:YeeE/YedE family protein [Planctomycetota bacterium]MBL7187522.1 YeeE/YedE family protein [Phycisphaerae bacterium]
MKKQANENQNFMNPYLAGLGLGLTLLASFLILGAGLGASSGIARIAACAELCVARAHTLSSGYFGKWGDAPLRYYLVFMLVGTFLGALCSALLADRVRLRVERGAKTSTGRRVMYAFAGGILVGFASRLANGCTSGQALTGSALLLTGSFAFLVFIFVGGYSTAWLFRRQWND